MTSDEYPMFDEPPTMSKRGGPRGKAAWRIKAEANPGKWVQVSTGKKNPRDFPYLRSTGDWKATNRKSVDGTWSSFVSYQPKDED